MSPIVYSTDPPRPEPCARCGAFPCICHLPEVEPRKQTAYVQRDRKGRGGKTVTVVSGLQHTPVAMKKLLQTLKTACGAGGTVRADGVEIQGDQRERVAELLRELGYKVKLSGG
jgi:translation initiation factor 1